MFKLNGKVAIVTGASRGVGKGIALGLGEAGATVYVTGRTVQEGTDIENLRGAVFVTAEEVTAMGGQGIAVACDHRTHRWKSSFSRWQRKTDNWIFSSTMPGAGTNGWSTMVNLPG